MLVGEVLNFNWDRTNQRIIRGVCCAFSKLENFCFFILRHFEKQNKFLLMFQSLTSAGSQTSCQYYLSLNLAPEQKS